MHSLLKRASGWMAAGATVCLVFLMLITFFDVIGRYFFNAPVTFAVELIELGMGLLVFLGLGMTTLARGHIAVDLLGSALPRSFHSLLFRIASLTGVVFFALVAWRLWDRAANFMSDGLATQVLFLPVYPVVFLMAMAAGISALIAVFQFLAAGDDES